MAMNTKRVMGPLSGVLLFWGVAVQAAARIDLPSAAPTEARRIQGEDDFWFPVGEEIVYTVSWGRLPVAVSRATSAWVEHEGRKLIAIRFTTKSKKILSALYPVDDFIESLIDPETFLPVQFTKKLSEGRYRCHEVTTFDHQSGLATYQNKRKEDTKQYSIEEKTRDLVSFMYSMRTISLPVGGAEDFRVMADEKLYDLTIKALEEQSVKLPKYGNVESIVFEPEAAFQGLFVRKGKMKVWVSEDDRKIITKASIKIPLAQVHLVLDKVTGPGDDKWVAKKEIEERIVRTRRRRTRF